MQSPFSLSVAALDNRSDRAYHESMDESAVRQFCREAGIELLVIFGSAAAGAERKGSDVDLAVKMRKGKTASKLDLIYQLGGLVGDREVDLVVLTVDTDPVLLFEMFSRGKPLFEERADLFAEERLRAFKLYYDTEKLRRLRDEYLREYAGRSRGVA